MTIDVSRSDVWVPLETRRSPKNHRKRIFFGVFVSACIIGLGYTFIRPPIYLGTASLVFSPPERVSTGVALQSAGHAQTQATIAVNEVDGVSDTQTIQFLMTELERLTSPSLMEAVAKRLSAANSDAPTVSRLQTMLQASRVPGTNIIDLHAEGHDAAALPAILNAWIQAYLDEWSASHRSASASALDQLRDRVKSLQQQVEAKRKEVDDFQNKYGLISADNDENEAPARIKSLTLALNDAKNAQVTAQSNVQSMRSSIAHGTPILLPEDKAALSSLESEAIKLREKIADKEYGFTPLYMAKDPELASLKSSLAGIESRIKQQRASSQDAALSQARQAETSAQQTVERLTRKLRDGRRAAMNFESRHERHKALLGELNDIQALYNAAQNRLVEMQASDSSHVPQVSLLDPPSVPDRPVYPEYMRDAGISMAVSVLLGLLAVWFAEFLMRPSAPLAQPVMPNIQIAAFPDYAAHGGPAAAPSGTALLPPAGVDNLPRELTGAEVTALLGAAASDSLLVLATVLSGLTLEDLASLKWDDIDIEGGVMHLPDGRVYTMQAPLRSLLARRGPGAPGTVLFADPDGKPLTVADLEGLIACAAYDAGIGAAADITARVLRHTYVAFLVRQGLRMGELSRLVGHVPPLLFTAYGRLAPPGAHVSLNRIDAILPALRQLSDPA